MLGKYQAIVDAAVAAIKVLLDAHVAEYHAPKAKKAEKKAAPKAKAKKKAAKKKK